MSATGEVGCVVVSEPDGAGAKRAHRRAPIPIPDLRGEAHQAFLGPFWGQVERRGPDDCWLGTGPRYRNGKPHPQGYWVVYFNGRRLYAHRLAYAATHGAVPAGAQVLHSCDNPPCVNPRHLHLGDQQMNLAEMASRERGTHRYSAANVDEMRRLRNAGVPVVTIAAAFGTTKQVISLLLSGRHGVRRYSPTTEPPIPSRPRVEEQIDHEIALALIGMGHSVGSVAMWLGVSGPSLRSYVRRVRALDHPVRIDAAGLALLLDVEAVLAPVPGFHHLIDGVVGPLPPLTLAQPGVTKAIGGLLHRRTRLTPDQHAELRARYQTGEPIASLSERFGICREHASRLARGLRGPAARRTEQPVAP